MEVYSQPGLVWHVNSVDIAPAIRWNQRPRHWILIHWVWRLESWHRRCRPRRNSPSGTKRSLSLRRMAWFLSKQWQDRRLQSLVANREFGKRNHQWWHKRRRVRSGQLIQSRSHPKWLALSTSVWASWRGAHNNTFTCHGVRVQYSSLGCQP